MSVREPVRSWNCLEKWSHTDFVGGTFFLVMETGSRMSRKFREWQPEAGWLLPPSPRDWLPEDHLVYFLLDVTGRVVQLFRPIAKRSRRIKDLRQKQPTHGSLQFRQCQKLIRPDVTGQVDLHGRGQFEVGESVGCGRVFGTHHDRGRSLDFGAFRRLHAPYICPTLPPGWNIPLGQIP